MYKYILLLFSLPFVVFSETSLWEISKDGYKLYLGGTIHMLKKEDYPLPIEFDSAFNKSDLLVFETDIEKAQTPEFAQKMTRMFTYPAGKSLKDDVNNITFKKLKKHFADRSIPIEAVVKYKPAMIIILLSVIEFKRMGMVDIGVDQYFYNKAKDLGRKIDYFETVDEQLAFLSSMGKGDPSEIILSTMNDITRMDSMMAAIKSAWLNGDESKLANVTLTEMMRDYPDTYQILLVKRNNNWMPHIERMLKSKEVEMVLVGALHLVGKDGLLQLLRNKGYTVKIF